MSAHPRHTLVLLLVAVAAVAVAGCTPPDTGPGPTLAGPYASIATGDARTCAVTPTGALQCWGDNERGALGDGTTTDRTTPAAVVGLGSGVGSVAPAANHTCALLVAGTVQCWGWNYYGQLGNGTTADSLTPVAVVGLGAGVRAVDAANHHSCAITAAGGVKCWGRNDSGELGNGSATASAMPVDVVGLGSGVVAIALGSFHSCALTTAGAVKCWGGNYSGELGDGTTTDSTVPVDVTGLAAGVVAIDAGGGHTCARMTDGSVKCWGYNGSGQLGDNTTVTRLTPVDVLNLAPGVTTMAAGGANTCALPADGKLRCWGDNAYGSIGDGTTVTHYWPAEVSGLTAGSTAHVAVGSGHACRLSTTGWAKCWGYNGDGQLGNGTTARSYVPVNVVLP